MGARAAGGHALRRAQGGERRASGVPSAERRAPCPQLGSEADWVLARARALGPGPKAGPGAANVD